MDVGQLLPVEETSLLTVYARALDSSRPQPILGDRLARVVVDQIDYDFPGLGVLASTERFVALRAKMLDQRIRAFVTGHPDAVVVDLGAGLSSAVFRVDPPADVDWYSVDLPRVIELREAVLPRRPGSHCRAVSLAESGWTAEIPADRPAFVFADGLFAFLAEPTFKAVLDTITGHFESGVLAFYDYGKVSRMSRLPARFAPTRTRMAHLLSQTWAFDGFADPHHLEGWNADLRLVEEASALGEPDLATFPPSWRAMAWLSRRVPAIARTARVLSYGFGPGEP